MKQKSNSVKIVQVDGKDIYLSNSLNEEPRVGYTVLNKFGMVNTKRFRAALDYSLELIKLRDVYQQVYGRDSFSFRLSGFEYTTHVCSVTFKYSVKEFNRITSDIYIRYDADYRKAKFEDCVWIEDGEVLGIKVNNIVRHPIDSKLLGKCFDFSDGKYMSNDKFKTIMNASKIREWVYENGFYMDGIKFIRYKRSAGSARTGKCLFIDEKLYALIHDWEMCGLKVKEGDECDLAGIESYISLTASSIIGAIDIRPENILIVDDYESVFRDRVVAVFEKDGHLAAEEKDVEVVNSIWDGESLIDVSLMGEYAQYGFVLLRNSFFKSAAFNCNLQQWFRDNGITDVSQLNGKTVATDISQVKYIITPSSLKYLKYGTFEDWITNVNYTFGVVKHEKPPKFLNGRGVKVSYQLINTLAMSKDDVEEFLQPSIDYLNLIRNDVAAFRHHINFAAQSENDMSIKTKNDIIYRILGVSDAFCKTKLFREFKRDSLHAYISELKLGHIVVNGNYSVLAGNVMELLNHSIGNFNGKSILGVGNIHSKRFGYGRRLLGCRSPHTSSGNIWLPMNVEDHGIDRYFNFTNEIVAINSIGENVLQRLSGADFDSDTVLLTDNNVLIRCGENCYQRFKVPTVVMDSKKRKRKYTSTDKASLDNWCNSDRIGVIVNLSQEINTIMWDRVNAQDDWKMAMDAYYDNCLLSILSGVAIDSTKKEYSIDCMEELNIIRAKYDDRDEDGRAIRPKFFGHVARKKGYYNSEKKNYKAQMAPMDFVQEIVDKKKGRGKHPGIKVELSMAQVIDKRVLFNEARNGYVDLVVAMVRDLNNKTKQLYSIQSDVTITNEERRQLASSYFEKCINGIRSMELTVGTMKDLLLAMDKPENSDIKRKLCSILFGSFGDKVIELLRMAREPVFTIVECSPEEAQLHVFDIPFKYANVA